MASAPSENPDADDQPTAGASTTARRSRGQRQLRRERIRRRRSIVVVVGALAVVAAVATPTIVWAMSEPRDLPTMTEPTSSATPTKPVIETVPDETVETTASGTPTPEPTPEPGTHPIAGDIASASSITVLVNKLTPLDPIDFTPGDLVYMSELGVPSMNGHALRYDAAHAVDAMFAAAAAEGGFALDMTSGYRSAESQSGLYSGYVEELGQEGADATSARPGYSEHQTGLAADISAPDSGCILEQCFADTAEGQWLAANAWRFGFILRYPDGATPITGYEFEPWHFRYVGVDVSTAMHEQNSGTYEEFLGAPAAPGYAS